MAQRKPRFPQMLKGRSSYICQSTVRSRAVQESPKDLRMQSLCYSHASLWEWVVRAKKEV